MADMHSRQKNPELKKSFSDFYSKKNVNIMILLTVCWEEKFRSATVMTVMDEIISQRQHYTAMSSPEDKQQDSFLATDCIATEKLVSGEYNSEVFAFGDSGVRKLLADIQVEEQNHAEMLYKYKMANNMA